MYYDHINIAAHLHKDRQQELRENEAMHSRRNTKERFKWETTKNDTLIVFDSHEPSKPTLVVYTKDEDGADDAYVIRELNSFRYVGSERCWDEVIIAAEAYLLDYSV